MSREEITEAKRKLYHALLELPHFELTDSDVEIMHRLCLDPEIREIVRRTLRKP